MKSAKEIFQERLEKQWEEETIISCRKQESAKEIFQERLEKQWEEETIISCRKQEWTKEVVTTVVPPKGVRMKF